MGPTLHILDMRKSGIDRFVPGAEDRGGPLPRTCDHEGCNEPGLHRAPRSRHDTKNYYWFCLFHVREYNKSWNYFEGLSDVEVEAIIRRDTVWERPTWPLGAPFLHMRDSLSEEHLREAARVFAEERADRATNRRGTDHYPGLGDKQRRALGVFELDMPVTLVRIKARYKELVKKHHPDANGGDKQAEERLKEINEAYRTLTTFVMS